ncbi:MAG: DUF1573 domain-containing protein [Gemmataceae bacterium]|nr:DUF1573 domain-containing protein [Gemmataceae bacterium]MCI0739291.1 DUF1573 domain-containing protein [Gemmataceae bacterium]
MQGSRIAVSLVTVTGTIVGVWFGTASSNSTPRIECRRLLDLGRLSFGQRVVVPLSIRNCGDAVLQIEQIETSCGCLSLSLQSRGGVPSQLYSQLAVKPRDQVELSATLAIRGERREEIRETVRFRTNDPAAEFVVIEFTAQLAPEFAIPSPNELHVRNLAVGARTSAVLTLRDGGTENSFQLARIVNPFPEIITSINIEPGTHETNNAGFVARKELYRVELEFSAPDQPVTLSGELQIVGAEGDRIHVPVHVSVVPRFQFIPSTLVLPRKSEEGEVYSATCVCQVAASGSAEIVAATVPSGFLVDTDSNRASSGSSLVRILCDPKALPNPGRHIIVFTARQGDFRARIELPVVIDEIANAAK